MLLHSRNLDFLQLNVTDVFLGGGILDFLLPISIPKGSAYIERENELKKKQTKIDDVQLKIT